MFQESVSKFSALLISVAPYNHKTVALYSNALKDSRNLLMPLITDMNKDGEGIYAWNADSATVYFAPQSFTSNADLDKEFLLPPSHNYKAIKPLNDKERFIQFNCIIENPSLRTNNYTGFHPDDASLYMTTLQFPGDEALLAPMGTKGGDTVPCGLDSPEHKCLKSIKPVIIGGIVQQVKLEFHDGSFYIFPDAETGMFTATDKVFGSELQGRVENLTMPEGSWKEAYTEEMINRIFRNIDKHLTIEDSKGNAITSAIAWRTTKPSTLKVIVPTDDGTKLITIPMKEV